MDMQETRFPAPNERLKFKHWQRTQKAAIRFYADFEATLEPMDVSLQQKKTIKVNQHRPSGYSWVALDWNNKIVGSNFYNVTEGSTDPAELMLEDMLDCCEYWTDELNELQKEATTNIIIDDDELTEAERKGECCLCKDPLSHNVNGKEQRIVRHHSHIPPTIFIGLAHNFCNLQARIYTNKFTCFIHNGGKFHFRLLLFLFVRFCWSVVRTTEQAKNSYNSIFVGSYDYHFLVQVLGKMSKKKQVAKIEVIPKTSEKFVSMSITREVEDINDLGEAKKRHVKLTFLDSLSFTLTSLNNMVKKMLKGGTDKFNVVKQEFKDEIRSGADISLLFKKGVFPYEYVSDASKLLEKCLPPRKAFYSSLTKKHIRPDRYRHAKKVWSSFKCGDLAAYQDIYVRLDTALLADCVEEIRSILYREYEIDIAHYYSLPMVANDALFKFTKQELQFIRDPNMYCWFESAVRGGFCGSGSLRAATANNPYMGALYDKTKPKSYLTYVDANNLCKYFYFPLG
jgi:hypothetical protein